VPIQTVAVPALSRSRRMETDWRRASSKVPFGALRLAGRRLSVVHFGAVCGALAVRHAVVSRSSGCAGFSWVASFACV
jgi:hypothetical protein